MISEDRIKFCEELITSYNNLNNTTFTLSKNRDKRGNLKITKEILKNENEEDYECYYLIFINLQTKEEKIIKKDTFNWSFKKDEQIYWDEIRQKNKQSAYDKFLEILMFFLSEKLNEFD